jgi:hypothetical protein
MTEYDPLTDGMKVNIIDGGGSLADVLVDLKDSIDALKASVDALALLMQPT